MRSVLLSWIAAAVVANASGLDFPSKSQDVAPKPDADSATVEFSFSNKSEKPVTIKEFVPDCDCLKLSVKGGKMQYAPGESGVLRATVDITNLSGEIQKGAHVRLEGEPAANPSSLLTVRVHIPVLVEISPKSVRWDLGEKPDPKVISITMHHDKPIHVLSMNASNPNFRHQLKTLEDGKRYELVVTPENTATPGLSVFGLVTDCDIKRHKNQQAYADVFKPLKSQPRLKP